MNAEQLKREIADATQIAWSIHNDMVDTLSMADITDTTRADILKDIGDRIQEAVSSMAALAWYLEHIREEVSA